MVVPDALPRLIPKSLKPKFRYPKPRPRLTTIMAVDCKEGVVLAADGQETNEWPSITIRQLVNKIDQVSYRGRKEPHCLLGFSGAEGYIDQFEERIGKAISEGRNKTHSEALDDAICDFAHYLYRRDTGLRKGQELNDLASAVFVGYDPKIRKTCVYTLLPPHPPIPLLKYPHRTGIGSGWPFAGLLFTLAESLLGQLGLSWKNISTQLVAQFCYIALGKVMNYEGRTGLASSVYKMDESGNFEGLSVSQIFPGIIGAENKVPIALRTLLKEKDVPRDKLLSLIKRYDLLSIIAEFSSGK